VPPVFVGKTQSSNRYKNEIARLAKEYGKLKGVRGELKDGEAARFTLRSTSKMMASQHLGE
jgi:hypothetical protein